MNMSQRRSRVRRVCLLILIPSVMVAAALFGLKGGVTIVAGHASAQVRSGPDEPFYAATEAQAKSQGELAYGDRPANVQAIMQLMYGNGSRYHMLSALFVDHEPMVQPGSLQIDIQQPNSVRTTAFDNDTGSGPPSEQTAGDSNQVQIYSPSANAYTILSRPAPPPNLAPLNSAPLSVVQREDNATTIYGAAAGARGTLADMFVQPAMLLTGPLFTTKRVTVVGHASFAGRPAWELSGQQIPTAPVLSRLGDAWNMWVDSETGIVLRIEYYRATTMIGWADMRNVTIDGNSQAALQPLSVPAGARHVDLPTYLRLAKP